MSLVRALIISNVLDQTISLEALVAAFRIVDAAEGAPDPDDDHPRSGGGGPDPRDVHAMDIVIGT